MKNKGPQTPEYLKSPALASLQESLKSVQTADGASLMEAVEAYATEVAKRAFTAGLVASYMAVDGQDSHYRAARQVASNVESMGVTVPEEYSEDCWFNEWEDTISQLYKLGDEARRWL